MAAFAAGALGAAEEVRRFLDLATEVAAIKALSGDGLGEGLQFAEREAFGEEFGAEGRGLVEAPAEVGEGLSQQQGMVEGEGGEGDASGKVEPSNGGGVALRGELVAITGDEPDIEDGDNVTARVAAGGADGADLFEEDLRDAGFFLEFAKGGGLEVLVLADESAGKGPGAAEGLLAAFDEKDTKAEVLEGARDREQGNVDGDGRTRPRVAVFPLGHRFSG